MSQFWFARLRPGGRGRMSPVSREGWIAVAGFVIAMVIGAVLFAGLMAVSSVALGVVLFVLVAILAGGGFVWAAVAHSDGQRTVADYRRTRQGGST